MLCYLSILYKVKNPEGNMKDHCYMIKQLPLPSLCEREQVISERCLKIYQVNVLNHGGSSVFHRE